MSYPWEWPAEQTEELRRLFAAKMSMGRIAITLGRSRSAIAGKLRRLGWKRNGAVTEGIGKVSRRERRAPMPRPKGAPKFNVVPFRPREPDKPLPPLNIGVYDLTPAHCRWPVSGERAGTLFCGNQRVTGSSYCAAHAAISTSAGTVSERQAHHIPKVA
jgi:GcrA cell cycle regulator